MDLFRLCGLSVTLSLVIQTSNIALGDDWPQFRGPNGNGVIEKIEHPIEWGKDNKNVAWSVNTDGGGLSSPIVVNDKIFLTSAIGAPLPVNFAKGVSDMRPKKPDGPVKFHLACMKLQTGEKLWEKTVVEKEPAFPIHGSNSFATESPVSDGEQVYAYFAAAGIVAAFDMSGKEVWKKDIGAYPTGNGFGSGSSLTTGAGLVFVQCDNDKNCFVIAFDAKSGEQKWKAERKGRTSWSTPLYWKNSEREELIACGSGFVTSYEPKSGKVLWKISGVGSAFTASPAADKDRIYFGNSGPMSSGPLLAVSSKMTGENVFKRNTQIENLTWSKMNAGPGMSSPVAAGGYLYIPSRSRLTVYSTSDGKVAFKERLPIKSMVSALWASNEYVFMMDENGKAIALKVGPEMNIVATNQIDDQFWSTPAISGKSLLLRGVSKLYCVRAK